MYTILYLYLYLYIFIHICIYIVGDVYTHIYGIYSAISEQVSQGIDSESRLPQGTSFPYWCRARSLRFSGNFPPIGVSSVSSVTRVSPIWWVGDEPLTCITSTRCCTPFHTFFTSSLIYFIFFLFLSLSDSTLDQQTIWVLKYRKIDKLTLYRGFNLFFIPLNFFFIKKFSNIKSLLDTRILL